MTLPEEIRAALDRDEGLKREGPIIEHERAAWSRSRSKTEAARAALKLLLARALSALTEQEQAIACVIETFERDEGQGYRSRDRQFAIDVLRVACSHRPAKLLEQNNLFDDLD